MNPMMFADWRRVNRLFTRAMWVVAVILALAVWTASSPARRTHHHRAPPGAAFARAPRGR